MEDQTDETKRIAQQNNVSGTQNIVGRDQYNVHRGGSLTINTSDNATILALLAGQYAAGVKLSDADKKRLLAMYLNELLVQFGYIRWLHQNSSVQE